MWSGDFVADGIEFDGKEAFEIIQIDRVELPEALHPDGGRAQGVGVQLAPDHAAAPFAGDQACIGQHAEVFGNGGERHLEGVGDIGDGHVIFQKHRQDRPARRVGKGGEGGVKREDHAARMDGRQAIVNRMVEYGQGDGGRRRVGGKKINTIKATGYMMFAWVDSGRGGP
jgi:hypothetical protein